MALNHPYGDECGMFITPIRGWDLYRAARKRLPKGDGRKKFYLVRISLF